MNKSRKHQTEASTSSSVIYAEEGETICSAIDSRESGERVGEVNEVSDSSRGGVPPSGGVRGLSFRGRQRQFARGIAEETRRRNGIVQSLFVARKAPNYSDYFAAEPKNIQTSNIYEEISQFHSPLKKPLKAQPRSKAERGVHAAAPANFNNRREIGDSDNDAHSPPVSKRQMENAQWGKNPPEPTSPRWTAPPSHLFKQGGTFGDVRQSSPSASVLRQKPDSVQGRCDHPDPAIRHKNENDNNNKDDDDNDEGVNSSCCRGDVESIMGGSGSTLRHVRNGNAGYFVLPVRPQEEEDDGGEDESDAVNDYDRSTDERGPDGMRGGTHDRYRETEQKAPEFHSTRFVGCHAATRPNARNRGGRKTSGRASEVSKLIRKINAEWIGIKKTAEWKLFNRL